MAIIYFAFFGNKLHFYKLKFSVTSLLLTLRNTAYIMKLGFATLLTEFAIGVMMLTGNHLFMKELGENGVAAFAVVCYLFPMVCQE